MTGLPVRRCTIAAIQMTSYYLFPKEPDAYPVLPQSAPACATVLRINTARRQQ